VQKGEIRCKAPVAGERGRGRDLHAYERGQARPREPSGWVARTLSSATRLRAAILL